MQEFFMDYGLWLLVALLVIIALVFLLAGRGKNAVTGAEATAVTTTHEAEASAAVPAAPITPPIAEPIVPSALEPAASPEPAIAPTPVPASPAVVMPSGEGDNLLRMKGIGPKLNQQLLDLGVTHYAQIASWTDADIAAIDAKLGNFRGRPVRDQWVDQAKYLAAGDYAGFEAKYGKL